MIKPVRKSHQFIYKLCVKHLGMNPKKISLLGEPERGTVLTRLFHDKVELNPPWLTYRRRPFVINNLEVALMCHQVTMMDP